MKNQILNKKEAFKKLPFFISYFISEPEYYDKNKTVFKTIKPNIVCFRDKENTDLESLAKQFLKDAREENISKVLINTDIKLALDLGFDGVHLNSTQFDKIKYAKSKNLFVISSCHTIDEIELAYKNNADCITYSPIFHKENKGQPKGIDNLKKIIQTYQTDTFKIIALGGIISNNEVNQIKQTNAYGFASIRYFYNQL